MQKAQGSSLPLLLGSLGGRTKENLRPAISLFFLSSFFFVYFWFCLAFLDVPCVSPIPAEVGGFDCLVPQMITRFGNGGGQENETTGLLQGERCPLDATSQPSCPLPSLEGRREPARVFASAGAVTTQIPALDSLGEEDAKAHRGHGRRWP